MPCAERSFIGNLNICTKLTQPFTLTLTAENLPRRCTFAGTTTTYSGLRNTKGGNKLKRVIKSSFGLRDRDWVDPDPEEPGSYYEDELWIPIKRQSIHVTSDGTVSDEDMEWLLTRSVHSKDLNNSDWGFNVVTEDEAWELIESAINDVVKSHAKPNSDCVVSGRVVIQYSYWVSEPQVPGYGDEAELMAYELKDYDPDSIQVDNVVTDDVVLERL